MHSLPIAKQEMPGDLLLQRHRHVEAYAAVVLAGGYLEAGEAGRRCLRPGDVAVHAPFSAHLNRVGSGGARVLNLPLAGGVDAFCTVPDPEAVVRLAQSDATQAAVLLRSMLQPVRAQPLDWPDQLALDLADDPPLSLAHWAALHGLAPETLSRGFAQAFGVTPKRWRYESRARRALQAVVGGSQPLAAIALDLGFCDQAQMTRAVVDLSGRPPGAWRATSSRDKTRPAAHAKVRE